ncbi:hypothetical protein C4J81_18120 [Deltaproteobacteria bacterium Smac51]|nr:hypothetical protein C4J81_18120 [Deltaproteobacteria bacterium Smac51]
MILTGLRARLALYPGRHKRFGEEPPAGSATGAKGFAAAHKVMPKLWVNGRRTVMTRLKIMATAALALLLMGTTLEAQSPEGAAQPYVIQSGDSLSGISKKFYGKTGLGQKLWQANRNLVSHPDKLTPGDTIYIFPESTLSAKKTTLVPPPPQGNQPAPLYDHGQVLDISFPKYFNFVADGRGLGGSGSIRVKVRKADPQSGAVQEAIYEVRDVGEIIASSERGGLIYGDGADKASVVGRTLMSTNDEVMVRFTEDLAKILDSDTYGDSDPYFREFPIYGTAGTVREATRNRVDKFSSVGELYTYKGKLTVVARVEGLAPISKKNTTALKKKKKDQNQDVEPVSYVARITYTEDAVGLTDRVFLFYPLEPGPERQLDPPFVEPAGTYNSLGN